MFPFLFGFFGLEMFDKLFNTKPMNNTSNPNNNSYQPNFDINVFQPSSGILTLKGKIEGFRNVAYKSGTSDPVTVGTGLTYFSDGTKPILGKSYTTEYLNNQLRLISKSYIDRAKSLAKRAGLVPVTQKQIDVLYYLFFNGLTASRQESWLTNHASDKAMANWLFTKFGVGPNFLTGSDRQYFVGIIGSRYRLSNYLVGKDPDDGYVKFMSQFPKYGNGKFNQVLGADYFNQGKIKTPYYL